MPKQYASTRNVKFLLNEVFQVASLTKYPYFQEHDQESINLMVDSARQLADTLLHPYYEEMDKHKPELKDGKVTAHPQLAKIIKAMGEGGWIGSGSSFEHWGQQMPEMVRTAANYFYNAANNGAIYHNLTTGAGELILSFASEELKEKFVPRMFSGEWQGTMCLTEPQAGSSLSDITTTAYPTENGYYKIKGQKIFISGGDHDAAENVVHLVLARIEGAPLGVKGISLFIVPKKREENGALVSNDLETAGLFHKLGQNGIATAHLVFGDKDNCQGYLIGEPHRGLSYMFQMMNGARLDVGLIANGITSAAYYAALEYAKERPQGRMIKDHMKKDIPQTAIIHHSDVQRMLLMQKSVVEGGLSLIMECAALVDKMKVSEGEEKEDAFAFLDLLTPIAKTYPAEAGIKATSEALQCFGGYGFTVDFPAQQFYRDIRITSIYEGTTGIQSKDLLGRKVTQQNGKGMKLYQTEINKTVEEAKTFDDLKKYADKLAGDFTRLEDVTKFLLVYLNNNEQEEFFADATLYLDAFSQVTIAWQWLKQATAAKKAIVVNNPTGDELDFYESKIQTMKYFYKYELPKINGLIESLKNNEFLTISEEAKVFV